MLLPFPPPLVICKESVRPVAPRAVFPYEDTFQNRYTLKPIFSSEKKKMKISNTKAEWKATTHKFGITTPQLFS